MTATLTTPDHTQSHTDIQSAFICVLPRILRHTRYALRRIGCPDAREELTAETLALAWRHFAALARRGRRPEEFVATLALRCTQAVRAGRRAAGCDRVTDVLSPTAKVRHGISVVRLEDRIPAPSADPTRRGAEVVAEALAVDPKARVPEQAALRIDFPEWRSRFGARDRAVLDALASGERPGEVAERFALSPARVSQLREAFRDSWYAFHRGL